jgi:hypothetical protein
MLAGDADRERAVETLKDAFTEGRLTQGEYEDRIGLAFQARTSGELGALTHDLPRPPLPLPPGPPRTNSKAVGALVCGVSGVFVGVTAIPAIVLGHMARREIRRTGEQGDGMAVGGLVLGYVVTIVMLVAVTLAVALITAVVHEVR